ncbi:AAA family ATPase, partial [bacterium]|nr:AAA family ATPase [bacterium]
SSDQVESRVSKVLDRLNLSELRDRPPHHLSFGEKRRAALATALAMNPSILLLDEPTANLDPATRRELAEYLAGLDATLLIATHDLEFVKALCPRVILLSKGRLITEVDTSCLLQNTALLRNHRLA